MKPIMVVVADSVVARIFTAETSRSPLSEIENLTHVEGRLHDRDLTSDLPGKFGGKFGSAGHSYTDTTDPKKHELSEFARYIANYIESARKNNQISNLLLVAAPIMLGELRSHLSDETRKQIVLEVGKNFTANTAEDIRSQLPKSLLSEVV
ncbi:host attachment protein [Kaarinaea lacus]